ncbi:hypothetical protein AAE478_010623 [Parahypoxylon ruwenzoriense]
MRSRPYTPPPPFPTLLTELTAYLPNRDRRDGEVALADLDPETSQLLPQKRQQHHVRIQGRLAQVRSVSVVSPRSASLNHHAPSSRDESRVDAAVGGTVVRRRRSSGDIVGGEAEDEVGERDTQLRGYGIGGRGNIRRPTEVIGTSSRTSSLSLSTLFSPHGSSSAAAAAAAAPQSPAGPAPDKTWSISGIRSRIEERKGK